MEVTRHFTATTFVVCQDRVLLHRHKKLDLWLPVGGHIDRDELPEAAAFREVQEEAGLAVRLYDPGPALSLGDVEHLLQPMHLVLENINLHHQHIDFIYYGRTDSFEVQAEDNASDALQWFTAEELEALDAPKNVKVMGAEALALLSEP